LKKKEGAVDFEEIFELYEMTGPENFFEALSFDLDAEIDEYLKFDVLSLALVEVRFRKVWEEIPCVKKVLMDLNEPPEDGGDTEMAPEENSRSLLPLWTFPSLPAAMFSMLTANWGNRPLEERKEMQLLRIPPFFRKKIKADMVGGGCSIFDHDPGDVINEQVLSLDVCAQYPSIMTLLKGSWFPCGKKMTGLMTDGRAKYIKWCASSQNFLEGGKPGFGGYVVVNFDQSNLVAGGKSLLEPKKKKGGGNDWSVHGEAVIQERICINFYRYAALVRAGCKVEIVLGEVYMQFANYVRGYDMFKELMDFMDIKRTHDRYEAEGNPLYNSAMQTVGKLGPNATSGKFAQREITEKFEKLTEDEIDDLEMNPNICEPDSVTVVCQHGENDDGVPLYWVTYSIPIDSAMERAKPIWISDHIWTLARQYIYWNLIYPLGHKVARYWDTDSVKFTVSNFPAVAPKLSCLIPVWPEIYDRYPEYRDHKLYIPGSKIFASFEDEFKKLSGKILAGNLKFKIFIIQPKVYAAFGLDNLGIPRICLVKMKGIRKESIFLVNPAEVAGFTVETDGFLAITDQKAAAVYYNAHRSEVHWEDRPADAYKVFEALSQKKPVLILQQQFFRIIRNHLRGVLVHDQKRFEENFGTVRTLFVIKKITA